MPLVFLLVSGPRTAISDSSGSSWTHAAKVLVEGLMALSQRNPKQDLPEHLRLQRLIISREWRVRWCLETICGNLLLHAQLQHCPKWCLGTTLKSIDESRIGHARHVLLANRSRRSATHNCLRLTPMCRYFWITRILARTSLAVLVHSIWVHTYLARLVSFH